jgi:hypothetical protein
MPEFSTPTATALSIAQSLLIAEKDVGPITKALITQKVTIAATVVAQGNEDSVDKTAIIAELIRRFSLWIGRDTALSDMTGHEAWLSTARKKNWRYWPRYRDMLERKMSATAVDAVDKSTDRILGLMEDPGRTGAWDRRGLVVGHVQSGKTANYSGLICKAADAGLQDHRDLGGPAQQPALADSDSPRRRLPRLRNLGYGRYRPADRSRRQLAATSRSSQTARPTRTNNGDFNTKIAKHLAISPEQRPWLFVVKKNKTVLDAVCSSGSAAMWPTPPTPPPGKRFVTNLPLL